MIYYLESFGKQIIQITNIWFQNINEEISRRCAHVLQPCDALYQMELVVCVSWQKQVQALAPPLELEQEQASQLVVEPISLLSDNVCGQVYVGRLEILGEE